MSPVCRVDLFPIFYMAAQEDQIDFRIAELIARYLQQEITESERMELDRWRTVDEAHEALWVKLTHPGYVGRRLKTWHTPAVSGRLFDRIQQGIVVDDHPQRRFPFIKVAAAIATVLSIGLLLYRTSDRSESTATGLAANDSVRVTDMPSAPATLAAKEIVLTMADGRQIPLNQNRELTETDGTSLQGNAQALTYVTGSRNITHPATNSVSTPKGLTYQLILSDGTKVWLSSQTTLRFPVSFLNNQRSVDLDGEAYFDVSPDKEKPFIVNTSRSEITVLGTSFNVKAYAGEQIHKTSLVTGAVSVSDTERTTTRVIKPGYEAIVDHAAIRSVNRFDLDQVLAWKNGWFVFANEPLEALTNDLSRWYNVRFRFDEDSYKDYRFSARLKRTPSVVELLDVIAETAKVKFVRTTDGLILVTAP